MAVNLQAEVLRLSAGMDVVVHESIGSTNDWCLQQCKEGKVLPFACFAENQTAGRGRRGKHWYMSPQSNIALSLAWPFLLSTQPLHLLSLTIALAVVEMLENLGLKHVQIKWPNDVYVQGKKIAGVLIETRLIKSTDGGESLDEKNKQIAAVIGVGLNYDMSMLEDKLPDDVSPLTDVCKEVVLQSINVQLQRTSVASKLLCAVAEACRNNSSMSESNLAKFRKHYDFCKNKQVDILTDDKKTLTGIAQGVTNDAELLVLIGGEQHVFNSADVSVKTSGVRL